MTRATEPTDRILDEIHKTRRKLLSDHGGVAGLAAFLRKQEATTDREIRGPEGDNGPNKPIRRCRK